MHQLLQLVCTRTIVVIRRDNGQSFVELGSALAVVSCPWMSPVPPRQHPQLLVFLSWLQHAGLGQSGRPLHHSDQRDPFPSGLLHVWDEDVTSCLCYSHISCIVCIYLSGKSLLLYLCLLRLHQRIPCEFGEQSCDWPGPDLCERGRPRPRRGAVEFGLWQKVRFTCLTCHFHLTATSNEANVSLLCQIPAWKHGIFRQHCGWAAQPASSARPALFYHHNK